MQNSPPSQRRQALLAALALATPAWAQAAAQGAAVRVGVLKIVSHAALDADEKGFEAGLASAGFKEGLNVTYVRRNALGNTATAQAMAKELIEAQPQLLHAIATPSAQAILQTGSRLPLVFSAVTDPVAAGLVPANSAPGQKTGTHVTGTSDLWPVQLQMETYAKAMPEAKVWGTVYNPAEGNSVTHIHAMRAAAKSMGLTLVEETVASGQDVARAALALVSRVQAITITSDNTTVAHLDALVKVCNQHRRPLFAGDIDSVARGAVMAYGMDYFLVGYAAGKKAALVLKGIAPGDVPWGPVEKFSLVINAKAARAQGLTLSPALLARADRVIP